MRNLIQEACQGPVRDAVARLGERVAELQDTDLRPVSLRGEGGRRSVRVAAVTDRSRQHHCQYDNSF